jgi:hypothetical protein
MRCASILRLVCPVQAYCTSTLPHPAVTQKWQADGALVLRSPSALSSTPLHASTAWLTVAAPCASILPYPNCSCCCVAHNGQQGVEVKWHVHAKPGGVAAVDGLQNQTNKATEVRDTPGRLYEHESTALVSQLLCCVITVVGTFLQAAASCTPLLSSQLLVLSSYPPLALPNPFNFVRTAALVAAACVHAAFPAAFPPL